MGDAMNRRLKSLFIPVIIFALIFGLTSCSLLGGARKKPAADKNPKPQELTQIEKTLDSIIQRIQKVEEELIAPPEPPKPPKPESGTQGVGQQGGGGNQDGGQGSGQESGGQQGGGQQEGGGQGSNQQDGGQQAGQEQQKPQQLPQPPQVDWKKVADDIEKLHKSWTSYQASAKERGISDTLIWQFNNEINILTQSATKREQRQTALSANKAYGMIGDFENYYDKNSPPELKKVTKEARDAMFLAFSENWEGSLRATQGARTAWDIAKPNLKKEDRKITDQIEVSIKELGEAVGLKDKNLVKIEGNIVLDNLKKLK